MGHTAQSHLVNSHMCPALSSPPCLVHMGSPCFPGGAGSSPAPKAGPACGERFRCLTYQLSQRRPVALTLGKVVGAGEGLPTCYLGGLCPGHGQCALPVGQFLLLGGPPASGNLCCSWPSSWLIGSTTEDPERKMPCVFLKGF